MTDRFKALQALQETLAQNINGREHTICIVVNRTIENPPREVFQWRSNTNQPYSPAFADLEACQEYPKTNGLNPHFE